MPTTYLLIGALVLVVLLAVTFVVNRLMIAGVSEAIVVSGSKSNGEVKVVPPGGKTFVIPFLQKASIISLQQRKISLQVDGHDVNKIPVTVRAVALVKVGSESFDTIRVAAERFDRRDENIEGNVQEVLLGSLRAILGQMTIEQLVSERTVLSERVADTATKDLAGMGLTLDSLQVNEIADPLQYIENLGVAESERVKMQARIARANADREANDAEVASRTLIAERNKELEVRQAELKAEQDQASAISDASGPLAKAQQDAVITEREQAVAQQRAILRERELETEVKKPADARLYDVQKQAEADKARQIAEAQAAAEAIRLRGEAEATATRLRGEAEAEALAKRAEALKQFNEAAVLELVVNKLPEIAKELAAPMGNIDELTILSTEGAGALPKTVANNFGQLDSIVKSFTGKSFTDLVADRAAAGEATAEASAPDSTDLPPAPKLPRL